MVPRAAGVFWKHIKPISIFIYYLITFLYFQCDGNEITLKKVHEFMRIVKKASKTILILTALTLFYITVIQLLATADYEHKSKYIHVRQSGP